jgi:hypothetical protein
VRHAVHRAAMRHTTQARAQSDWMGVPNQNGDAEPRDSAFMRFLGLEPLIRPIFALTSGPSLRLPATRARCFHYFDRRLHLQSLRNRRIGRFARRVNQSCWLCSRYSARLQAPPSPRQDCR